MSRLTDLIAKAKTENPQFAADFEREFRALSSRLPFGLNFERHRPEAVELPQRLVRRGDKVRVLPPRGSTARGDQRLWLVTKIVSDGYKKLAELERLGAPAEKSKSPVDDLVVVAEFLDTIYPGLVSTGKASRGGDKPYHTVINGENYHVLKALTWTHRGKVDAIYIDPPYNTGAKDWKYNNDYVEGDDIYRHSKWLAFMERRLRLAKELLNPTDSVLIVTIDEKEYLRLGLLLEQVFPEGDIQMVTSVMNRAGSQRAGRFSRVEEYIFYVMFGESHIHPWTSTMLEDVAVIGASTPKLPTVWFTAVRRGTPSALRGARPKLFYPVYLDAESGQFIGVGDPISKEVDRHTVPAPEGAIVMWPIHSDGTEQTWRFSADRMREKFAVGTARLGKRDCATGERALTYLQPGTLKNIKNGIFIVTGRSPEGALELAMADGAAKSVAPRTVWSRTSHFARDHGSTLLKTILGAKRFDFPKSLFAVEDTLRFVISGKPDATVVDFFAGSGTTAHAVMRLNKQDSGKRQCISVTNNEVGADEQKALREQGLRPGDAEWERLGICDYVTKPRVEAAITGKTPAGKPIEGLYQFGRPVEKEKPRCFKQIGFSMSDMFDSVTKKKQLVALVDGLPQTLVKGHCPFIVSEEHASSVLFDPQCEEDWLKILEGQRHITDFYIVTPDKRTFDKLKKQVSQLLGPVIVTEEEKLPMADGFEENTEFFTLTYETLLTVSYQTAFARIAPLLWMRAGSMGRSIEKLPSAGWEVTDAYGLLVELDRATDFLKAACKAEALRIAYIVTDDERRFQALARRLPEGVEAIRLYESYLTNFAFANGDDA